MVVFETFLSIFRNCLFSHTANRVDVELGSRLIDHIVKAESKGFILICMIPGQTRAHFGRTGLTTSNGNSGTSGTTLTAAEQTRRRALMTEQSRITKIIEVLEAFNGNRFVIVNSSITTSSTTSGGGLTIQSRTFVALSQQQIDLLYMQGPRATTRFTGMARLIASTERAVTTRFMDMAATIP